MAHYRITFILINTIIIDKDNHNRAWRNKFCKAIKCMKLLYFYFIYSHFIQSIYVKQSNIFFLSDAKSAESQRKGTMKNI